MCFSLSYWQCTLRAASALHDKLFQKVLHSPMAFFDTTPLGRILNRFSRDMDEGKASVISLPPFLSLFPHMGVGYTHSIEPPFTELFILKIESRFHRCRLSRVMSYIKTQVVTECTQ